MVRSAGSGFDMAEHVTTTAVVESLDVKVLATFAECGGQTAMMVV